MAKKTIMAQMKQRRDSKANWESTNPVLLDGELGIVSDDPNLYKVGDGATAWNSLPFRGFDGTLAQELGTSPNAVISQKVVSAELQTLSETIDTNKTETDTKLTELGTEVKTFTYDIGVEEYGNYVRITLPRKVKAGEKIAVKVDCDVRFIVTIDDGDFDRITDNVANQWIIYEAKSEFSYIRIYNYSETSIPLEASVSLRFLLAEQVLEHEQRINLLSDNSQKLNNQVKRLFDTTFRASKNLFNPLSYDFIQGVYIKLDGDFGTNSIYAVSPFIPISFENPTIICSIDGTVRATSSAACIAYYDEDKNFVKAISLEESKGIAKWEEGVSFVRFSLSGYSDGNIQIERGHKVTEYSEYMEEVVDSSLVHENLLDIDNNDFIEGKFLGSDGVTLYALSSAAVSPFIRFTQAMGKLTASVNEKRMAMGEVGDSIYCCLYNSEKQIIASSSLYKNKGTIEWQDGVEYARFSFRDYTKGKLKIEVGGGVTPYVPFDRIAIDKKYISQNSINSIIAERKRGKWTIENNTLANGESIELNHGNIAKGNFITVALKGDILNNGITIGIGKSPKMNRCYMQITQSKIIVYGYDYVNGVMEETDNVSHGLDSTDLYASTIIIDNDVDTASVKIISQQTGKVFVKDIDWFGCGDVYCTNNTGNTISVNLTSSPKDLMKDVWVFGDSYTSMQNPARWTYYMKEWGYTDFLLNSLPGINSFNSYINLESFINEGFPKYIVWLLGMNDGSDSDSAPSTMWLSNIKMLIDLCEARGIEPILATIPTVPSINHQQKNMWIRNSGYTYIDMAAAVNASASGIWREGLLSSDEIHPTELGAKAIVGRILFDFPQIVA